MKFAQDLRNCDMTSRSYFGKMNSTLGSIVPLAMFLNFYSSLPVFPLLANVTVVIGLNWMKY